MAVLAHCWFIIEYYLIPDGFMKLFFLSFYINPLFLFFCRIFLWIKTLKRWIFLIIFFLNQFLFACVLGVLRRFLIRTSASSRFSDINTEPEDEDLWYDVTDSFNASNTASGILFLCYESSLESPKVTVYDVYYELVDQETVSICSSSDLDDDDDIISYSSAGSPVSSYSFPSRRDEEVISSTPSSTCNLLEDDQEAASNDGTSDGEYELRDFVNPLLVVKPDEEEEKDLFYQVYTERMKWFDLLNQERTCGLNEFLRKKQYMDGEKRIMKSLESDFEMVYVAQSCLSWEALYYQYRKLESIIASSCADTTCTSPSYGALCSSTLVNKFQRFHILLERFMEDERSEKGKRYWNFIQKRSSLNSLLQVPHISENVDVDKEGTNKGLTIRATDMLQTIEKCIKTFKPFIDLDEKRPWWRARSRLSWNHSPLEDPRDFNFLHNITRTLQQKELWMKDLQGKQRCWLRRRVKIMAEAEKREMMFAMIDLKLVSRVLMMSVISTSQLQWCRQKLDSIEISHGRITRPSSCTASSLFPPS